MRFVLAPDNWSREAQRYVDVRVRVVPVAPAELLKLTDYFHQQFKAKEAEAGQRITMATAQLDDATIQRMAAEDKALQVDHPAFAL